MTISPNIAAIPNITPNHLDRHGTMEAYAAAKARILAFQSKSDIAILGHDDEGAWSQRDQAIAVKPEVILMDEPCSALDPIATLQIEELMRALKANYTIVIVTHNMQQAARVSDHTAMMMLTADGKRSGTMIEYDQTQKIFTNPKDRRTEDYVTGRFG